MPQPPKDREPSPTPDEVKMLRALAKFGSVHPISEADVERLESLQAAGYVIKDRGNLTYSLTVRGWAFVRKAEKKGDPGGA